MYLDFITIQFSYIFWCDRDQRSSNRATLPDCKSEWFIFNLVNTLLLKSPDNITSYISAEYSFRAFVFILINHIHIFDISCLIISFSTETSLVV